MCNNNLIYTRIGAGITAAAGTRLALQWILIDGFGYRPLQSARIVGPHAVVISRRCLISVDSGQFARLLPSLDVAAVSQATSPESYPNTPLPVNAMVVHYTTIES